MVWSIPIARETAGTLTASALVAWTIPEKKNGDVSV
jgi:hypothetical protein